MIFQQFFVEQLIYIDQHNNLKQLRNEFDIYCYALNDYRINNNLS